jgi:hypothetical protein
MRKTAAFTWSIEHSIAAWDCGKLTSFREKLVHFIFYLIQYVNSNANKSIFTALFLTKWIHTVDIQEKENPANGEERAIIDTLRDCLDEVDCFYDGTTSLAAEVTRTWTLFLDDVWVWESMHLPSTDHKSIINPSYL